MRQQINDQKNQKIDIKFLTLIRYQSIAIILGMLTTLKGKGMPFLIQLQNKANQVQKVMSFNTCKILSQQVLKQSMITTPVYGFSTYFSQLDKKDVQSYTERKYQNKKYRGLIDLWKKPLQRKKKRQQRIKQIKAQLPVPPVQQQKLIVHNSTVGIQYPPAKNEIFCVVKVNGFQYKVSEDCVLILDTTEDHEINKTIKLDEVLLAGTATYTLLGRPLLKNTYVEVVVESISDSEKTLVFKKKRRKQYKKSFGSRVKLTSCRVVKIVHELTPETMSRAVSLVEEPKSTRLESVV